MDKPRRGLSLGTRIFLSTGLIVLAAIGAAVAVTSVVGGRIGARAARDRIAASASLQAAFQQQRFAQLKPMAQLLAGDPAFKAYIADALANADRLSVLDQLEERAADLGYDLAMLVRPDGTLFARTDQPDLVGVDLSSRALVQKARAEYEAAGIWQEGPSLYEAVAVPVVVGDALLGYLVVGTRVTDVRALEVKRGTGSDVLFLTGTPSGVEPVASTLSPPEVDRLLAALRLRGDLLSRVTQRGEAADGLELEVGGARWAALLAPLDDANGRPVGALASLASLDRELAGYTSIRNVLLATGAAAIAAALGLAWAVSRRVLQPVGGLLGAVDAARRGDYDVTPPPGGAGEVVELAGAFNALLADLRERRDMAEYVGKLSRSLPDVSAPSAATTRMPAGGPESGRTTLLGVELRRYVNPRPGGDPAATLDRYSRDLRRISAAVGARGGRFEAVVGPRVLATFSGPARSDQALAAAAEIAAAVGARESAFDDAEPPAQAIAAGEILSGAVSWGEGADRSLLGLPMQQIEGLLREAGPGEVLLSPAVHAEVAATLARAGVAVEPQRGLLSTQPLYLLTAGDAAHATGGPSAPPGAPAEAGGADRATLSAFGAGSLLGARFEILGTLGAGGMGRVFKARDRDLDDVVALKMLKPEVAGDRALVERLKSELKLARKITHPNVLRTFDFGEIDGVPYISMEYVRGLTLRAMLEQSGRLPFKAGLHLSRQILSGLAAAHALGILHRDIKPENIILDAMGDAKLMDFGLARPVDRLEKGVTQAGFIVGTPHYLAPEQLQGLDAGPPADVYACGVVLYEIFTGHLPLGGENAVEILMQHLKQPPVDPRTYWPEMPARLQAALLRCLEKEPSARFAHAGELAAEIERL